MSDAYASRSTASEDGNGDWVLGLLIVFIFASLVGWAERKPGVTKR